MKSRNHDINLKLRIIMKYLLLFLLAFINCNSQLMFNEINYNKIRHLKGVYTYNEIESLKIDEQILDDHYIPPSSPAFIAIPPFINIDDGDKKIGNEIERVANELTTFLKKYMNVHYKSIKYRWYIEKSGEIDWLLYGYENFTKNEDEKLKITLKDFVNKFKFNIKGKMDYVICGGVKIE